MSARTSRWLIAATILVITVFLAMQTWTVRMGLHRYRSGDRAGALSVLKVARILNPFDSSVSLALADIYLISGQTEKAEKILSVLVARSPKNARAHNLNGVAMQARGRIDEAMKEYELSIKLDPEFAIAYFNRGYLLLRTGQREKGMEAINKAVELEPELAKNKDEALKRLDKTSTPSPAPVTPE